MTTEQKIREAFEKRYGKESWWNHPHQSATQNAFTYGYMSLLNELEPSYLVKNNDMLYRLPEGVKK